MKNLFILTLSTLVLLAGCDVGSSSNNNTNNVNNVNNINNVNNENYTLLKSDLPREEAPDIEAGELASLVDGMLQFHFDLYAELAARDGGNIIYSPWSIDVALAMTWAGARNATETEIAGVLNFPMDQSLVHAGFNSLESRINGLGAGGDPLAFQLTSANSLWGQENYGFETAFLDTLAVNYGAGLYLLDFAADPEAARVIINAWVAAKTNDKITELLQQGTLDAMTRLVLVNTLYFKAKWLYEFAPDATSAQTFHNLAGSDVTVDFMTMDASGIPYYEGTGYRAAEMPFVGDETSMIVVMPDAGTFSTFEAAFDGALLDGIVQNLALEPYLFLEMPKFDFRYNLSLKSTLEALGMTESFQMGTADFTGMHNPLELYISDVIHEAFIGIDEAGCEAGAATAVIMSGFGEIVEFKLDNPFLFFIRDNETGVILFAGRVTDPSL
ncbi:serpin family protein [Myxococcota bacterium]|nr:serpin family protein [Myxococcota bacterium]MBU1510215.1 serpin family protein [Myxococcota bacterium]